MQGVDREGAVGCTVEIVQRRPKIAPREVLKVWVSEWAKEGALIEWEKLLPPKAFGCCRGGGW